MKQIRRIVILPFITSLLFSATSCSSLNISILKPIDEVLRDSKIENSLRHLKYTFLNYNNDKNYVINTFDNGDIERFKSFPIKTGKDNDFLYLKTEENDIYDVVKMVGIPFKASEGNEYNFSFVSKSLNIYELKFTLNENNNLILKTISR